jgi:hypothetical protein
MSKRSTCLARAAEVRKWRAQEPSEQALQELRGLGRADFGRREPTGFAAVAVGSCLAGRGEASCPVVVPLPAGGRPQAAR